jgi:hypothetical protein
MEFQGIPELGGANVQLCIYRVVLIGSLVISPQHAAPSQTTAASVVIGNTEIVLGMSAQPALASLQENFKDVVENHVHQWVIESKTEANQIIGVLYANDKAIKGVEHLVFSRNLASAEDVFNALYEVSSKLSQKTKSPCIVSTWTNYDPVGLSVAGVHFICGPFRYRLLRGQFKSNSDKLSAGTYQLWEDLGVTKE